MKKSILQSTILQTQISQNMEEKRVFPHNTPLRNMNQLRIIRGRTGRSSVSFEGTETVVRNRCSYHVPVMAGTNASTNENHTFYNSKVQTISRGGGDCSTKVGDLYAWFVNMGPPVKNEVEMGWVISSISGDRSLICLTKLFSPKTIWAFITMKERKST